MTDEERLSMSLACCTACFIAEALKDCPKCAFYPSLAIKALRIKASSADYPQELFKATRQNFITAIKAQKGANYV